MPTFLEHIVRRSFASSFYSRLFKNRLINRLIYIYIYFKCHRGKNIFVRVYTFLTSLANSSTQNLNNINLKFRQLMRFMLYTYLLLSLRNNFLKFHPCGHKIRPDMQNITKLITSERSRRTKTGTIHYDDMFLEFRSEPYYNVTLRPVIAYTAVIPI